MSKRRICNVIRNIIRFTDLMILDTCTIKAIDIRYETSDIRNVISPLYYTPDSNILNMHRLYKSIECVWPKCNSTNKAVSFKIYSCA